MLLVMEYHSKGSLHDVLRNDRVRTERRDEGSREEMESRKREEWKEGSLIILIFI